jgi:hypothetical protein
MAMVHLGLYFAGCRPACELGELKQIHTIQKKRLPSFIRKNAASGSGFVYVFLKTVPVVHLLRKLKRSFVTVSALETKLS